MAMNGYHRPHGQDIPDEDESDSDLDIDLQELDPVTSDATSRVAVGSQAPRRASLEIQRAEQERRGHIALRNWRPSGLRAHGRRLRGYEDLGGFQAEGDENEGNLLGEGDDENGTSQDLRRDSTDEAPLLGPGSEKPDSRWGKMLSPTSSGAGRGIRLPSFALGPMSPGGEGGPQVEHDTKSTRTVFVGQTQPSKYPPNAVSNAKYTAWSFLPRTLYNEFSFFFNLYFLLVALSQIIRPLRIGYLSTYVAPLAFVLFITLGKEAIDDIARRRRDTEANSEPYRVIQFSQPSSFDRAAMSKLFHPTRSNRRDARGKRLRRSSTLNGSAEVPLKDPTNVGSAGTTECFRRSRDLKVGDVLKLEKDQRIPADVIVLKSILNEPAILESPEQQDSAPYETSQIIDTSDGNDVHARSNADCDSGTIKQAMETGPSAEAASVAETFIRTDQLDGETDWKLRLASPLTQHLRLDQLTSLRIKAGQPEKNVNEFIGTVEFETRPDEEPEERSENTETETTTSRSAPLTIENTAWANTVLASSSTTLAVVVYTGPQTRQALSTSASRSKVGLLEHEINSLTKILCLLTLILSIILVALEGFETSEGRKWYVAIMRFLILFSTIIPISLRVNLDMGKSVYAWFIERDEDIKGAIVRTSTIPEELGRVEYLLSDKTGTLTQNEMEMKKIHVGTVSYANEAMEEVSSYIRQAFGSTHGESNAAGKLVTPSSAPFPPSGSTTTRTRREIGARVRDVVLALALCHNVTPVMGDDGDHKSTTYQASSPDEIAIIKWTESVGLRLVHRDRQSIVLQSTHSNQVAARVQILNLFPFTSDGKRMGIVVKFSEGSDSAHLRTDDSDQIWFYQKGADTVMSTIVAANDWLDEETANMAREGLRTLVVGRKKLSQQQYAEFSTRYEEASLSLNARDANMAKVIQNYLEKDLELLGVTGVEDKLQRDVKPSLELLRNAGVKIWMLTGDKVETARCVAVSAKLVARGQYVHTITKLDGKARAQDSLDFLLGKPDACLLIDGESLKLLMQYYRDNFISLAVRLPAVIACRCSPTQKADIAKLIRAHTKKRICCIGDGGNDVSMIQAADVGVGIVGKEGRQASLSADFSIEQFCHLTKLLVWHGRNSYKRSAKLAQFVIHRGLIISVCQTMFSIASKFEPVALYKDWLLVGYATVYTMAPVFSLVLDKDVDEKLANLYPELYKELTEGRSLSYRTFFVWVLVSIYQGGMIQGLSQILVEVDGPKMVAVSFTVLVINELIMVAFEITTWHPVMIFSLIGTALVYFGSIPFLGRYFDLEFVISWGFVWRVAAILAISLIPPYAAKLLRRTLKPPSYRKVQGL